MSAGDDGGLAFPWGEHGTRLGGLTMRDWFAGQALNALISAGGKDSAAKAHVTAVAAAAYQAADAMIVARKGAPDV